MIRLLASIALLCSLLSCEKEFTPQTTFQEPQLVVEGYIEVGQNALPPYALLTKSTEYSNRLGTGLLNDLFVNDAVVRVTDGVDTIQLLEYCISDLDILPPALRDAVLQALGLPNFDANTNINICVYTDLLGIFINRLDIREGGRYELIIEADGFDRISAITTIPDLVVIDSLGFIKHPKAPVIDSLVEVEAYFTDPVGSNYYRAFTKRNSEPFYPASTKVTSGSASDDTMFEGRKVIFQIVRGQDQFAKPDLETFGYFWRGDTVTFKACNIDYEHFRFWQTMEYNARSQGPFSTYTRVKSNIKGGLGLWGGIISRNYTIIIPE